jgi:uncharacterized cupredoxin-like copper-binding protein
MKLKTLTASILLIMTSPSFAAGTHGDGHRNDNKDIHGNTHATPIGDPAKYSPENRQVEVSLDDTMRFYFTPSLDTLKEGEAVTFIIRNDGKMDHEFSIGTAEEQISHMEMMKKMPDMVHHDNTTVSLSSGAEAELNWRFAGKEEVVFSCNIPGHFEAGMHHKAMIVSELAKAQ